MRYGEPQVVWTSSADIVNGADRLLNIGGGESVTSFNEIADVRKLPCFRFGLSASEVLTLDIETAMDRAFTVSGAEVTLLTVAGAYMTCYDLPAPQNQTGYVMITRPYARVRITNGSGSTAGSVIITVTAMEFV